jgi:5-methylthioadenosine/S-adenosylhomocysteine deaminase
LEVGKKADLILVAMRKPHLTPVFDPVSHLVYAAEGSDVDTVVIDGKVVMQDRVVKTFDEDRVLSNAVERGSKLLKRAGIEIQPKWKVM